MDEKKPHHCNGKLGECQDSDYHNYCGDGIFTCRFYDPQREICELKKKRRIP